MSKPIPKNKIELVKMRTAGQLAARTLDMITEHVVPGVSTEKINQLCHEFIIRHNAIPAPLNYRGYPKSVCTSINEVVCHGIPTEERLLQAGDIINIDVTVILDGYHGDTSRMYWVDEVSAAAKKLTDVTFDSLWAGIETVASGSKLSAIGNAIQEVADKHDYGVVQDFCGHGLGKSFHEAPSVLHYAWHNPMLDVRLRKGVCLTIEPMINIGTWECKMLDDDWTAITKDGTLSAQFEHSLAVTEDGYEIFTLSPEGLDRPPYKQ